MTQMAGALLCKVEPMTKPTSIDGFADAKNREGRGQHGNHSEVCKEVSKARPDKRQEVP